VVGVQLRRVYGKMLTVRNMTFAFFFMDVMIGTNMERTMTDARTTLLGEVIDDHGGETESENIILELKECLWAAPVDKEIAK